ncbi:MAG TPA: hypothetical protein VGM79_28400 [Streptosporangiaceae bacterium]
MASPQSTRSVREIRDYLIERLNGALLRPGMYGNELTTLMHLGGLAWIERRDADLGSVAETLAQAGAWSSTAVRGAFQLIFGGIPTDHDSAAALVYAGIAQAWGYLVPQRGLPAGELPTTRAGLAERCRPGVGASGRLLSVASADPMCLSKVISLFAAEEQAVRKMGQLAHALAARPGQAQ